MKLSAFGSSRSGIGCWTYTYGTPDRLRRMLPTRFSSRDTSFSLVEHCSAAPSHVTDPPCHRVDHNVALNWCQRDGQSSDEGGSARSAHCGQADTTTRALIGSVSWSLTDSGSRIGAHAGWQRRSCCIARVDRDFVSRAQDYSQRGCTSSGAYRGRDGLWTQRDARQRD
jgi:hypothetical protein